VDDAAGRLVRFPKSMDVVLCMNLYGDILSDLAAGAERMRGHPRPTGHMMRAAITATGHYLPPDVYPNATSNSSWTRPMHGSDRARGSLSATLRWGAARQT
jgi:hypothetical protein